MLVLGRKIDESIVIEGGIRITVVSIRGRYIRLAIEAPQETPIVREELTRERLPAGRAEACAPLLRYINK